MKGLKKWILSALCVGCAFAGVATLNVQNEVTADAAVATEYTVVEDSFFIKLGDEYKAGGNFNLWLTIPTLDTGDVTGEVSFAGVNLAQTMDNLGFFDKVKIDGTSLRDYGCTGFWKNSIGFDDSSSGHTPRSNVHFYCSANRDIAKKDIAEVNFGTAVVTLEEGALIPGYAYLNGDENAKLYRAGCDYTMMASSANYGVETRGLTDVEEMAYVQGHDGKNGYLGVSLYGDDFLADGVQTPINEDTKHRFKHFVASVLVNGQASLVNYGGLYNLGTAGIGYYSFVIYPTAEEVESVTIPAGTLFPARAMTTLHVNPVNNNTWPVVLYEIQTTKTFYKNAEGKFVAFEGYAEKKGAELTAMYEEKVEAGCFTSDVLAMEEAIASAKTEMNAATDIAGVDAAFVVAKAAIENVASRATVVETAKAELEGYKSEADYFRAEEEAQRVQIVADAISAMNVAMERAEVETALANAKTAIDGLKTAAQYADEELAEEKANAKATISGYLADVAYLEEQAALRAEAVNAGLAAVVAAKNSAEITAAVEGAKTAIDGIKTKASIVDAATAELNAYKAEEGLYREAQVSARLAAIATAVAGFETAVSETEVQELVATAKATIDGLKTDAELTAEEKAAADAEFAEEKQIALEKVNEIKASVDYTKYSSESQAQINALYKTAKTLIEEAMNANEITAAVEAFEADVAKLPTIETNDGDNANDSALPDDANASPLAGCMSTLGVGSAAILCVLGAAALCVKKGKEE